MWLGVMATFVASFAGLLARSKTAAAFGAIVWLLTTLYFCPWQDFFPEPSDDPDVLSFQMGFRKLAVWWVAAGAASALSMLRAFWPGGRTAPSDGSRRL
jgi:hypothetical protein